MHDLTTSPGTVIRRALVRDAKALSDLALRSKASWGYDAAFLESVRSALTFSSAYLTQWPVYLLERDGVALGVYGLQVIDGMPYLHDLWIEPAVHGEGFGALLFRHALATGRTAGYDALLIESDPNAQAFYVRMGARVVGTQVSPDTGRRLPLLRVETALA